jgi:hypothetical protein
MDEIKTNAWYAIGYIFSSIVDVKQKNEISNYIHKQLTDKFEPGPYYLATLFQIVKPEIAFQNQYFSSIEAILIKGQQKRFYQDREYYNDSRIDNFLNYCLHFNLNIPELIKSRMQFMGTYYEWLNDPENFDYSHFNTDWLYNHFTISFKHYFRKSEKLKNYLSNLIKADRDTDIERVFIMIFCFND